MSREGEINIPLNFNTYRLNDLAANMPLFTFEAGSRWFLVFHK